MQHTKRRSKSRVIGRRFEGEFSEAEMEALLRKAADAGVVTEFDTGRGAVVWYNGYPGQALRDLTKQVEALIRR